MPVMWREGVVRHCEEPSVTFGRRCNLICHYYGLPRFARNDGVCSPDETTRNPGVPICIAISRIPFHPIRATAGSYYSSLRGVVATRQSEATLLEIDLLC